MNLKRVLPLVLLGISAALCAQVVAPEPPATTNMPQPDSSTVQPAQNAVVDTARQTNQSVTPAPTDAATPAAVQAPAETPAQQPATPPVVAEPAQPAVAQPAEPAAQPEPAQKVIVEKAPSDKSSTLNHGTYIRLGWMNPRSNYLSGLKDESGASIDAKSGYNFQLGSQFYIGPVIANRFRFGLDATWLDLSYAELDATHGHSGIASALCFGPLASYAPIRDLAVSLYFKVLPSFDFSVDKEQMYQNGTAVPDEYETIGRGAFSVNRLLGIELRYSLIEVGYEFYWGRSEMSEIGSKSVYEINKKSYSFDNQRLYIGLRF